MSEVTHNAPEDKVTIKPKTSDTRISSPNNVLNILPRVEIRPMNGRVLGTRSPSIPPMVKHIIGEAAHIAGKGGGCAAVAEAFDVHPNTVTAAKKGTGTAKAIIDEDIRNAALDRLVSMFDTSVSPEKLAQLETKDATRSMKDLAKVAESFKRKDQNVFNGPTIIIYSPAQHTESDYDVIDVSAREIK
jgi:hypothetical protein